jgi:ribosomal protein L11 methyltransferase
MAGPVLVPFEVGQRWRIVPPGSSPARDGRLEIALEWGAFGSGEHETTASCLEVLEGLAPLTGAQVLDVGCGTGILAIAALALGAAGAICIDLDPRATASCRRNLGHNGLAGRARLVTGELAAVGASGFELVVANIYADVLAGCAEDLVGRARGGGLLILSGIPWQDLFDIRRRYLALGCTVSAQRMLEEYATLCLRAPCA